ncbi:MAG: hypothetical protein AAF714_03070 [Pseudomonadota bacterium]
MIRFIALLSAVLATAAGADPFGIKMGAPVARYQVLSDVATFKFMGVPAPHPDFFSYSGLHSPQHGICRVTATSQPFAADRYGHGIQRDFDRYEAAISQKYGRAQSLRSLRDGSIWNTPGGWVMSVAQQDRVHATHWSGEELASFGLSRIELRVDAKFGDAAVIVIDYLGAAFEDCLAAAEVQENDAF